MARERFQWTLPAEIERRLGSTTFGRQRAIFEAGHLLLILHAPPESDDPDRDFQLFLRSPDGRYQFNGREKGEFELRRLLSNYEDLYRKYDQALERANDAAAVFKILDPLLPLNRAAINLHNALQSARDLVKEDPLLIEMRDEAYECSRNFELLAADAKLALDYQLARNAETQSEKAQDMLSAQHKLNMMAAITFPLMAIATLFGMNLVHGLENRNPILFWIVFAMGVMVGLIVKSWVGKRNDQGGQAPAGET